MWLRVSRLSESKKKSEIMNEKFEGGERVFTSMGVGKSLPFE